MTKIRKDEILGSRRFSNYWWATIIFIASSSFFLVGLCSYTHFAIFHFLYYKNLLFLPQGAIMTFYGTSGILISLFLWYTIIFNIGSGYNEFNKKNGIITIFRFGFPGKNRILKLKYNIKEIASIKIFIKDGLSPKREIYLKTKDKREIPLTKVSEPISLYEIEKQAKDIAKFINVIIEGI
uniref:Photosystem I assembly protein Ycf4 n=1 Tax=Bostrychia simpliciuscula TaxID=324754 RepID=A0A1Z1M840_9FLOR|nr:photosystem I assembly protein [Bostrychia simpliciuscula]ARW62062.1 photosystem I assembly protein [Bostrychia simpliciuscula]